MAKKQMPDTTFNPVEYEDLKTESQTKLKDFSDLLDTISSIEDKKKALWKHIYENAITDRTNAYICFTDLYVRVHGDPIAHATQGANLAKYLERMSKSTDQLLKLAELLTQVQEKEESLSTEDIYSQIGGKSKFQ